MVHLDHLEQVVSFRWSAAVFCNSGSCQVALSKSCVVLCRRCAVCSFFIKLTFNRGISRLVLIEAISWCLILDFIKEIIVSLAFEGTQRSLLFNLSVRRARHLPCHLPCLDVDRWDVAVCFSNIPSLQRHLSIFTYHLFQLWNKFGPLSCLKQRKVAKFGRVILLLLGTMALHQLVPFAVNDLYLLHFCAQVWTSHMLWHISISHLARLHLILRAFHQLCTHNKVGVSQRISQVSFWPHRQGSK